MGLAAQNKSTKFHSLTFTKTNCYMYKFCIGFLAIILISCGSNEVDLTGNTPLKPNQFFNAFKPITTSLNLSDTNLIAHSDTQKIAAKLLESFIPDSVVKKFISKDGKTMFYALGRIEKAKELYLLIATKNGKNKGLFTTVFDKKENNFLAYKSLLQPNTNNGYFNYVVINREPTFTICHEKQSFDKELKFTKEGWAYSSGSFVVVVKETNEKLEDVPVINPIDSFARNNALSGLYANNGKNFISIRDGKTPLQYLFFLHVEKNDGKCIGELKGEMKMTSPNQAIYNFAGDPCIIDFTFEGNSIIIKEQGSCGNRRGMDCLFEDEFGKKKEAKKGMPTPTIKPTTNPVAKPPIKKTTIKPLNPKPKQVDPKPAEPKTEEIN